MCMAYITDLFGICFTTAFLLWPTDTRLYETALADDRQVCRRLDGRE